MISIRLIQDKVVLPIIQGIAIAMMDNLRLQQISAQPLLHHYAMFQHVTGPSIRGCNRIWMAWNTDVHISVSDHAPATPRWIAESEPIRRGVCPLQRLAYTIPAGCEVLGNFHHKSTR